MIQESIRTVLVQDSGVAAIVGSKIYPVRLPREEDIPAVVYQFQIADPVRSLNGDSGLDLNKIIINCWAARYETAHALAYAVRNALANAAGLDLGTVSQNDAEDLETRAFCVVLECSVWSTFEGGAMNPILEFTSDSFTGDGVTTDWTFSYLFRAGSLLVFKDGALAEKDVVYEELSDRTGIRFLTIPAGGGYADHFLAHYAKA
jgi:hypothetical protein